MNTFTHCQSSNEQTMRKREKEKKKWVLKEIVVKSFFYCAMNLHKRFKFSRPIFLAYFLKIVCMLGANNWYIAITVIY